MKARERRDRMLARCLFAARFPTLDHWVEEFGVSRPSVVTDVKAVREWLAERRLGLVGKPGVGYSLVYDEFDLRNAMVQYLLQRNEQAVRDWVQPPAGEPAPWAEGRELLGNIDFGPVRDFLGVLQSRSQLADPDHLSLALYVAVTVRRLQQGKPVPVGPGNLASLLDASEHKVVAGQIAGLSQAYGVTIAVEEAAYLTLSFVCAKKVNLRTAGSLAETSPEGRELALAVAREAEEAFGVPLSADDDFVRLLASHVALTLRKIRFGLPLEVEAPTEYFKRQHPLAYGIGLRFCALLAGRTGARVPEIEATFLAMHVAAGLERARHRMTRRKRVALVCSTALSASTLLYWQLTNLLPQVDVVQVGSHDDVVSGRITADVDLIVSTVRLPPLGVRHVVISPLFTPDERRRILEALRTATEHTPARGKAAHLLDAGAIFLGREYDDPVSLLEDIGNRLVRAGFARRGFPRAMVERHASFGSALGTPVPFAMPHAGPTFTRRPAAAVVTLRRPVAFPLIEDPSRSIPVGLVVVPLLQASDRVGLQFYALLSALRQRKLARAVLDCTQPAEVIRVLSAAT